MSVLNVVVAQGTLVTAMVLAFVVTPVQISGLGAAAYGAWLLINSFVNYMRMLELGTASGTIKYGAGALERGDADDLRRVFSTSQAIFLGVAVACTIGTAVLATVMPRLYPVLAGQERTIATLGGMFALDMLCRNFAAALRVRSLHFVYELIEFGANVTFAFGGVLYLAHRGELTLHTLVILIACEIGSRNLLTILAALVLCPYVRASHPFRPDRKMFSKLVRIGGAVSVIQVADVVRFQLDAGVIGYFLPERPDSIALYGIGVRLPMLATQLISIVGATLMPRFSGLSETGDDQGTRVLLERSSLATGLMTAFVFVNFAVFGPALLHLWLHQPWVPESGQILRLMLPGYMIALLATPASEMLFGSGKVRGLMFLTVGEALANLCLSVALVRWIGVVGVALGTAIPMAFFRGLVFPRLLRAEMGIPVSAYVRMHLRSVLVAGAYLALVFAFAFVPMTTFPPFLACCALSALVFVPVLVVMVPESRPLLRQLPSMLRRRKRGGTSTP